MPVVVCPMRGLPGGVQSLATVQGPIRRSSREQYGQQNLWGGWAIDTVDNLCQNSIMEPAFLCRWAAEEWCNTVLESCLFWEPLASSQLCLPPFLTPSLEGCFAHCLVSDCNDPMVQKRGSRKLESWNAHDDWCINCSTELPSRRRWLC